MKPFKVLIAYDGSDCSKKALQDLAQAGLPESVEAVVLTIADTWLPSDQPVKPATPNWLTQAIDESEERRKTWLDDAKVLAWNAAEVLRVRFPHWMIRSVGKADSPAWGIVKYADDWQPDLIVMGCHGHSALGRFFLGSVSQKVLTHAHSSVRIVHAETPVRRPLRLLVAFDGSAGAWKAVYQIADRTWPKGTQIRLVSVIDEKIAAGFAVALALKRQSHGRTARKRFWMKDVVKPALHHLSKTGLTVFSVISEGDPAHDLIKEAKRWHAHNVFIGARGLIAIERFLLGSVSTKVAANAPCSVEIVR